MQRLILKRSVRRTTVLAAVSLGVAVATVALFATGILPPGDGETSTADVVDSLARSTVLVVTSQGGDRIGSGTGWALDAKEGLIVTNSHVVNGGDEFEVGMGRDRRPATLVGVAPCDDLAVLRVDDPVDLETTPLGSQSDLRAGDDVVALGFPESASSRDELTTTTGVVSVVRTNFEGDDALPPYPNLVRTDAAINPGNSGGPLVTRKDRRLVGVNTFGTSGMLQNANFAIGVDRVKEVTAELREGRSMGWSGMGFAFPNQEEDLISLGLPPEAGIVVISAVPGSPAADAGFGDEPVLILAVDGNRVDDGLAGYCNAVGDATDGDSAVFTIVAAGTDTPQDVRVRFA